MTPYYEHAGITIYHGDCRDVLPFLVETVDLVLTDPPYSVSKSGVGRLEMRYGRTTDLDFFDGDTDWTAMTAIVVEAMEMTRACLSGTGSVYVWCGHRQLGALTQNFEAVGWSTRFLVWSKECPVPVAPGSGWPSAAELCFYAYRPGRNWNYPHKFPWRSNVIVADAYRFGQPGKVDHPTQKPLGVVIPLLMASCPIGGIVLDPFVGSGTTLRAAKDLNLRAIGIEIEERYCEIAVRRLQQEVLPLEAQA